MRRVLSPLRSDSIRRGESLDIAEVEEPKHLRSYTMPSNKIHPNMTLPLPMLAKGKSIVVKERNTGFEIIWNNLSFIVAKSSVFTNSNNSANVKMILKGLSGNFKSGELTAVMGPSGAGKSSFLKCVCGKQTTGVNGEIKIVGSHTIKVAFVAQDDYLMERFTTREALLFASKVKNGTAKIDHNSIVAKVAKLLSLTNCLETRTEKCSGGQRKRISIALELVSKPNILILDEPTSGLDSSSCFQTVKALKQLTRNKMPIAIVATIHQPSARVFNLFDKVYVISYNGQCIYHGPTGELHDKLLMSGIECPTFTNPADYIIEIASGEYGGDPINKLVFQRDISTPNAITIEESENLSALVQQLKHPFFYHLWVLFVRSLKQTLREPHLFYVRIIAALFNSFSIGLVFGTSIGKVGGCPPTQLQIYNSQMGQLFKDLEEDSRKLQENFGSLFFAVIFFGFAGILPMTLVFPREIKTIDKQYSNGWYSVLTYFIAKTASDIPVQIIVVLLFASSFYSLTGQEPDLWRFMIFLAACSTMSILGYLQGFIVSIIFSANVIQATFAATMSTFPNTILSGFFVRYTLMPWFLRPLTYASYSRFAFESVLIALYGFDRCPYVPKNSSIPDPGWFRFIRLMDSHDKDKGDYDYSAKEEYEYNKEEVDDSDAVDKILDIISGPYMDPSKMDRHRSIVMSLYELQDYNLIWNFQYLFGFCLGFLFLSFSALYWKLNRKD